MVPSRDRTVITFPILHETPQRRAFQVLRNDSWWTPKLSNDADHCNLNLKSKERSPILRDLPCSDTAPILRPSDLAQLGMRPFIAIMVLSASLHDKGLGAQKHFHCLGCDGNRLGLGTVYSMFTERDVFVYLVKHRLNMGQIGFV